MNKSLLYSVPHLNLVHAKEGGPEALLHNRRQMGLCRLKINIGMRGTVQLLRLWSMPCRLSAVNYTAVWGIFIGQAGIG